MAPAHVFGPNTPKTGGRLISPSVLSSGVMVSPKCPSNIATLTQRVQNSPAMPSGSSGRPVRSTRGKRSSLAAGFIDSSTLKIASDSEGDDFDEDLRLSKKPRLGASPAIKTEQDYEASRTPFFASPSSRDSDVSLSPSPEPDPSELKYYPRTHSAVLKFNKILGHPPIDTDDLNEAVKDLTDNLGIKRLDSSSPVAQSKTVTLRLPRGTIDKNASFNPNKVGFMDLPGELRNQVYVLAFKKKAQIEFKSRTGFSHSAAFLRVNKAVYNEARNILYGENRFVFEQSTSKVGNYFDNDWKEVNYGHVRKFLTDIGPVNTSLITNIGFTFEDATPSGHPDKDIDERRFERNKDLYWILKYLGRHGKIEKLKLGFCGRRTFHLHKGEAAFLHALKTVKTDQLTFGKPSSEGDEFCRWHKIHFGKLSDVLKSTLEGVMVRPVPLKSLDPRLEF